MSWDERLALDIEYVNKITFSRDVSVVFNSFLQAVKHEDIAVDTNSVEPNFAEERKSKKKLEVI